MSTSPVLTIIWPKRDTSTIEKPWTAFQEWRECERLRRSLWKLSDRELMDIGIAHGEVDYVATNRDIDPRGTHV